MSESPDVDKNYLDLALTLARWTAVASMTAAFILFLAAMRLYQRATWANRGKGMGTLLLLLAVQAMFDMGAASWGLLGHPQSASAECMLQSLLLSFFPLAEMIWLCCIAYYLKWVCKSSFESVEDYSKRMNALWLKFLIVTIVTAVAATALPEIWNVYGEDDGVWCWIEDSTDGERWMFVQFIGPFVIVVVVCAIWCFQAATAWRAFIERHPSRSRLKTAENKLMARIWFMPVLLMACYTLPCINRIQHTMHKSSKYIPELFIAAAVAFCLGGLINAVLYFDVVIIRAACLPPVVSNNTNNNNNNEEDIEATGQLIPAGQYHR